MTASVAAINAGARVPVVHLPAMCWSYEVSLATVCLVTVTFVTLLVRRKGRDLGHAFFLSVFGSMQLVDLTLWILERRGELDECGTINKVVSMWGFFVIMFEPISALIALHINKRARSVSLKECFVYWNLFATLPFIACRYISIDIGCSSPLEGALWRGRCGRRRLGLGRMCARRRRAPVWIVSTRAWGGLFEGGVVMRGVRCACVRAVAGGTG